MVLHQAESGDPDLFVVGINSSTQRPDRLDHQYSMMQRGGGEIVIRLSPEDPKPFNPFGDESPTSKSPDGKTGGRALPVGYFGDYFIGVMGYGGPAKYTLTASIRVSDGDEASTGAGKAGLTVTPTVAVQAAAGNVICGTCGREVPERTYPQHEAFCARNNVKCAFPGCSMVLRKGQEYVLCVAPPARGVIPWGSGVERRCGSNLDGRFAVTDVAWCCTFADRFINIATYAAMCTLRTTCRSIGRSITSHTPVSAARC